MEANFRGTVAAIVQVATVNLGYVKAVPNVADHHLAAALTKYVFECVGGRVLEFKLKSHWSGSDMATFKGTVSAMVEEAENSYFYQPSSFNEADKRLAFKLV